MARVPLRLLVSSVAALAGAVAWTCLPDLPTATCGDGHIDPNETCDQGPNFTNPGCSQYCQVVCPEGIQGDTTYAEDPSSNHCYFTATTGAPQGFDAGLATCGTTSHIVTLVDEDEPAFVVDNLTGGWRSGSRFWLGVDRGSDAGPYTSTVAVTNFEPGWDVATNCLGCFMHGDSTGAPLAAADGGAEAGVSTNIVDTSPGDDDGTMKTMGGAAKANVVCEREPVGARSVSCGTDAGLRGSFCFQIIATSKRYFYSSNLVSAETAEGYCHSLSAVGTLVVFTTRKEREQVVYELTQLHLLAGGAAPPRFWIGLSYQKAHKQWVWDDGVVADTATAAERPSVWGDGQADQTNLASDAYAYIQLLSTAGIAAYDTGLAYNERQDAYPFVCNY